MFRKKFRSGSGSRPTAPGPREVPVPEPVQTAPRDPVPPAGAPSALKDIVAPRRPDADGLPSAPGHTLVVGRDIVLTGEIEACEKLIVEGRVEGEITDTRHLEITESGRFKGRAEVEECVVAGACEGEITVSGLLTVGPKGRIKGNVRYAEIEMQRGGRLSGEVELLTVRAVPDPTAAPTPAGTRADMPSVPTSDPDPSVG
ncbi:MAG: bactofilin family protein [Alphaproteobacteria bacterium]